MDGYGALDCAGGWYLRDRDEPHRHQELRLGQMVLLLRVSHGPDLAQNGHRLAGELEERHSSLPCDLPGLVGIGDGPQRLEVRDLLRRRRPRATWCLEHVATCQLYDGA